MLAGSRNCRPTRHMLIVEPGHLAKDLAWVADLRRRDQERIGLDSGIEKDGETFHCRLTIPGEGDPGHDSEPVKNSTVAWPSWVTPLRFIARGMVNARIFRSSHSERFSTYQTSISRRSGHGVALRPLICAQPVTPGRTSCRRA